MAVLTVQVLFAVTLLVFAPNLSGIAKGLVDVPCPTRAASGRIEAGQVQVIFHNPKNQREISIDYDGNNWSSSDSPQVGKLLTKQGFNSSSPTIIYLHAYTQSASTDWLQEIRRQYDARYGGQFNLMLFDWSNFSRQRYDISASWVPRLGQVLGEFLMRLQEQTAAAAAGDILGRTHLVSYSLSTHIAGLAGRHVKSATKDGQAVGRITALDPTGVCFLQKDSQFAGQYSLDAQDARLVVARHYDMGTLGANRPIGGVDVFVNGGKNQPTPTRGSGRFAFWSMARNVGLRAPSHMMASLNEVQEQVGECRNVAYSCSSYATFLDGECADCGGQNSKCLDLNTMDATVRMSGETATRQQKQKTIGKKMFIKTSQDSSCIYHYQAILRLKSDPSQAERKLLEEGSVSFTFIGARNQRAKVDHQLKGDRRSYSALLTTDNGQLADSGRIQMQVQSSSRDQDRQLVDLASNVDSLELNYMSHAEASVREKKSAKFCVSSKSNGILRKCS